MSKLSEKFSRKPKQLSIEDYLEKLKAHGLTIDGKEIADPVPLAPPIGYKKQPSMVEIVRDMVRGEKLRQDAAAAGAETFEESEDFDVGDEPFVELKSGYENDFDPPIAEIAKEVEKSKTPPLQPSSPAAPTPPPAPTANPPADGPTARPGTA